MYSSLPNKNIKRNSDLTKQFCDLGCNTYHDACDHVWRIEYGRTSISSDWTLVLTENVGTCSTKHALLKALADEIGLEVKLNLGIYLMKESNTPGVGAILSASNFKSVPEAHCYLSHNGSRVDLTRYGLEAEEPISGFLFEQTIEPSDIGDVKRQLHKHFILENFSVIEADRIWQVREKCINSLST
jgi:hypothetical protein